MMQVTEWGQWAITSLRKQGSIKSYLSLYGLKPNSSLLRQGLTTSKKTHYRAARDPPL